MISVYTFTLGRELYLQRLLESVKTLGGDEEYEHYICVQGVKLSDKFKDKLASSYPEVILLEWEENYGIAEGMNKILPQLKGDIIMKMDEDCLLRSPNFFNHVRELHEMYPKLVFSPYPVGLIGNPGGPPSSERGVAYGEKSDTYYTFRMVHHIGGFARISPANPTKEWRFDYDKSDTSSGTEDGQHSQKCITEQLPMAYLENALIVEHQESTLGQHARYGEDYFGKRF